MFDSLNIYYCETNNCQDLHLYSMIISIFSSKHIQHENHKQNTSVQPNFHYTIKYSGEKIITLELNKTIVVFSVQNTPLN